MKRRYSGLTLIELMIVVAIVGILAAVAIPQYQNFLVKTQVAEGLSLVTVAKTAISDYYSEHGVVPPATPTHEEMHEALGLPRWDTISGKYVFWILEHKHAKRAAVRFRGTDDVHSAIRDKNFYLIPDESAGSLVWRCRCNWVADLTAPCGEGTAFVDEKCLPAVCHRQV
ncbi:MAG: prepilin-type N-terminal cleavage/methylation domain-containing protein [Proteobacteria bacterium TMED51]|nr:MAG: prepilin-type N-terminal cleavage/methylation domain-containing protein [Proteobacteria bacterium TMED51]